jgi:hypothetical protein
MERGRMKRFLPGFVKPKRNDNSLAVASMRAMRGRLEYVEKQMQAIETALDEIKSVHAGLLKAIDRIVEDEL